LGKVRLLTKNYNDAEKLYNKALDGSKELGDKNLEGQVLEQFAILCEQIENSEKAKQYYADAQSLYENSGSCVPVHVFGKTRLMDEEDQNYKEAESKYIKALEYYDLLADQLSSKRLKNNISNLKILENTRKAPESLSSAFASRQKEKLSFDTSFTEITTSALHGIPA